MERKTGRKLLTLLISILLVCGICFAAYAEDTTDSDFIIKGKTLVKYTGMGGEVTVPEGIEVLGDEAFQETAITKINLPETVKEIGHHCFYACNSLKEITLPASLEGLEDKVQAFGANSALEAFSVAPGGHYIAVDGVLFTADGKTLVCYPDGKKDKEYSIPEGTVKLAETSFGDPLLEVLNIPSTLRSVGGDYVSFVGLPCLREINVDPGNKVFRSVDGVLYTSDTLMCYPNVKEGRELKADDFPAGLKRIAHNSFWGNRYLETVEFPEGLEEMGGKLFLGAHSLKTVIVPASVKYISYYSFAFCRQLEKVTILNPDIQPEDIRVDDPKTHNIFWDANPDAVLCGYAGGGLQAYAKKCGLNFEALNPELEIVDEIETESAAETVEETVRDIPETVTEPAKTNEDDFVIQGKTLVKYNGMGGEVTVPDGVEVLAQWAFESSYVTKVNLPETLKEIECYCFYGCRELEDITLPASLEKLGNMQAFAYNHSLKAINVAEGNPYFVSVDGVLFNKNKTKLLYYPAGRNQGGEYAIPEGVTELGGSAIQDTGLTAIELPSTFVKMYCGNDFSDNRGLTEIRVAKGNPVFHSVDGLLFDNSGTLICYPSGLTKETLGVNDFPAEMKAIGPYAFQFAQHLKNIEIPEGIKTIEWMCFTFSPSLQSVTVPASVNFIAGYAFAHCDNLEKVTILNPDAVIITDDERFSDDYRATMDFNIIGYSPNAVLYGYENSTAQIYAAQLKDAFESLGEAPAKDPNATPEPIAVSDFMPECQK
ncbi:leucine-rich repeat domain-containing protein [Clostridiales bacterium FE2011]|nr:leucine-rich repeat domain-containing protein [Clostridiales bacterium FE2011]